MRLLALSRMHESAGWQLAVAQAPAVEDLPISLAAARVQLRAEALHDEVITPLLVTACQAAGRVTQCALGVHELQLSLPAWPGLTQPLRLPYGPVLEVLQVHYVPELHAEPVLVPPEDWRLSRLGPWDELLPVTPEGWPPAADDPQAVRVTYRAGWTADTLPAEVRQAVLLMLGGMWHNTDGSSTELDQMAQHLAERRLAAYA